MFAVAVWYLAAGLRCLDLRRGERTFSGHPKECASRSIQAFPGHTNSVAMSSQAYPILDRLKRLGFKSPKEYRYEF